MGDTVKPRLAQSGAKLFIIDLPRAYLGADIEMHWGEPDKPGAERHRGDCWADRMRYRKSRTPQKIRKASSAYVASMKLTSLLSVPWEYRPRECKALVLVMYNSFLSSSVL